MDMTQIDEQWIEIPRVKNRKRSIVSISNTGMYKLADGTMGCLGIRQSVRYYGKRERCSHIIADHFLITVRRPDQTHIDHITHTPTEYNVNSVLNLRWCTQSENLNFEEARNNKSKALKGDKNPGYGKGYLRTGENSPVWKGDDVCTQATYRRAKNLYKAGKIIEEEFQPYRDAWAREQRQRRIAKKTSDPI